MPAPLPRTVRLTHDRDLPRLGLGTWPMSDAQAEVAVAEALRLGYRLVDTAYQYRNEVGVGRGLRAAGVPREGVFVTTKLNGQWHGYDAAQEAFDASAGRLGLDYVDLYLIHWPLPRQDRYVDAWRGLGKLLADGRVRAIGTSNFKPAHLDRLLSETGVVPDVNQVELNPYVPRPDIRAYDAEHGIVTQSWGPLGQGGTLLHEPVVRKAAQRHGRTPAQVVLRWHLQLGVAAVAKSSDPARMAENLAVFDFELDDDDMAAIASLDRGEHAAVDSDRTGH